MDTVELDTGFFESVVHSLLALWLAIRVGAEPGLELSLESIFERPTVRELAARFDRQTGG